MEGTSQPSAGGPPARRQRRPRGTTRTRPSRDGTSASVPDSAAALTQRIQRRHDGTKDAQRLGEREAAIVARYVGTLPASPAAPAPAFDEHAVLAQLVDEHKASFLKLDRQLSDDHTTATARLHASVFAHANDFIALFHEVDRASGLVETLKTQVQATKASITAISKFTYANIGQPTKEEGEGRCGAMTQGGHEASSSQPRRPSLISRRRQPQELSPTMFRGYGWASTTASASRAGGRVSAEEPEAAASSVARVVVDPCGASSRATTRELNVASWLQWRHLFAEDMAARPGSPTAANKAEAAAWVQHSTTMKQQNTEAQLFADVLGEETRRFVTEGRHTEAAELLRSYADQARQHACQHLVYDLEYAVVCSVLKLLHHLPITPMFLESVHIPLVQLLLRLGWTRSASRTFLQLQSDWLQRELHQLQMVVNPEYMSVVVVDFVVRALLDRVHREQSLRPTPSPPQQDAPCGGGGRRGGAPNTAALMWVRHTVDTFSREVLATHILSHGTGTEGGDTSRIQRAADTIAEAARAFRALAADGFGGCETIALDRLTPSLVLLEQDFADQTVARGQNSAQAMLEQLITYISFMAQAHWSGYDATLSADVARTANLRSHELLTLLRNLPCTSYTRLIELQLAPASCSTIFDQHHHQRAAGSSLAGSAGGGLSSESYAFLRYCNGCSTLHTLLAKSLIGLIASMTGADALPVNVHREASRVTDNVLHRQLDCVSTLFANAVVMESLDSTLHRLCSAFLETAEHVRVELGHYLCSPLYAAQHKHFAARRGAGAAATLPIFADASQSPPWVMESMMVLFADVLGAAVWIAYLARGEAVGQMLDQPQLQFRTQHVESLRRGLPSCVQEWLMALVTLGFRAVDAGRELSLLAASSLATPNTAAESCGVEGGGVAGSGKSSVGPTRVKVVERAAAAAAPQSAPSSPTSPHTGTRRGLLQLLMSILDREYTTPEGYLLHHAVLPMERKPDPGAHLHGGVEWCVRAAVPSYPEFPIGGDFDRGDELYLFHWCAQLSLHLMAFFQERLLSPTHVMNERGKVAGELEGRRPLLHGCVSPHQTSAASALCAGGGNYAAAVAVLQFLVVRMLRDALCRVDTWSAVYDCPAHQWRADERVLRQQLFFFALFARLWSPLFAAAAAEAGDEARTVPPTEDGVAPIAVMEWLTCSGVVQSLPRPAATMVEEARVSGDPPDPHATCIDTFFGCAAGRGSTRAPAGTTRHQGDVLASSGCYIPDTLLKIMQHFFETTLGEPRAIPAITSSLMRSRVDRALAHINLLEDEEEEEEEEEDEERDGTDEEDEEDLSTVVTLQNLRELLLFYVSPLR